MIERSEKAKGNLFVVSAPSGAGKTSLMRALEEHLNATKQTVAFSISTTTREPRPGEVDGVDYHFVSKQEFAKQRDASAFLESAKVFDNFYGTNQALVEKSLSQGLDVILEIDWQGAEQVRRAAPDCISIFILPPSQAELESRLRGRGQDSEETIARRMQDAVSEMSHWTEFDYLVVNDDFSIALGELASVFISQRLLTTRQMCAKKTLLGSLFGQD